MARRLAALSSAVTYPLVYISLMLNRVAKPDLARVFFANIDFCSVFLGLSISIVSSQISRLSKLLTISCLEAWSSALQTILPAVVGVLALDLRSNY